MTKAELQHELDLSQAELTRRERRILELIAGLRGALDMLDASSFGGDRMYRCLTPIERQRWQEIRNLIEFR